MSFLESENSPLLGENSPLLGGPWANPRLQVTQIGFCFSGEKSGRGRERGLC